MSNAVSCQPYYSSSGCQCPQVRSFSGKALGEQALLKPLKLFEIMNSESLRYFEVGAATAGVGGPHRTSVRNTSLPDCLMQLEELDRGQREQLQHQCAEPCSAFKAPPCTATAHVRDIIDTSVSNMPVEHYTCCVCYGVSFCADTHDSQSHAEKDLAAAALMT